MDIVKEKIIVLPGEIIPVSCNFPHPLLTHTAEDVKIGGAIRIDHQEEQFKSTSVGELLLKKKHQTLNVSVSSVPKKVIHSIFLMISTSLKLMIKSSES